MKTHIDLDEKLVAEIVELGQFSTKKEAVNAALQAFAKRLKRDKFAALRGKVEWVGDHREMRRDRFEGVLSFV